MRKYTIKDNKKYMTLMKIAPELWLQHVNVKVVSEEEILVWMIGKNQAVLKSSTDAD